jgi:hypothetical protein
MSSTGKLAAGLASLGVLAAGIISAQTPAPVQPKVEFNRDIRMTLSKCLTCHGPSSGEGAAGLRLDSFAGATKKLASGNAAIVPGDPKASALVERINSTDEFSVMPPPEAHKDLTKDEKRLLEAWIAQGAEYKEHWAFIAPVRPALPEVKDKKWARSAIDRFVLAGLEAQGMAPEQEAAKETLIRRLTLDITGLPPTPEEVKAFVADRTPTAYEKVVDRLLQSPRYGERMAMDWMDYSRYADSNGYQADYERFQSRWRDWVIEAFNSNMPYDEFTVQQIAGDLLPNPTMEQKLATAFNRNHRINTEGGVIAEEWRVETIVDRVETTSAVWLGLTAGCARCHNHKYDPLTQKEFYQLGAYFNNVPESGTGEERPMSHPPTMKAPTHQQEAALAGYNKEIARLTDWTGKRLKTHIAQAAGWKLDAPFPVIDNVEYRSHFDSSTKATGEVTFDPGRASGAVQVSPKGFVDLGSVGDFERDQAFSFGGWIRSDNGAGSPFSRMNASDSFRGWEASIYGGRVQAHIINKWPENALKIASEIMVPNGQWIHVLVTYDGSSKAAGLKLYLNGQLAKSKVEQDSLTETVRTTVSTKVGRRTDTEQFTGAIDDFLIVKRELTAADAAKLASTHPATPLLAVDPAKRTDAQKELIARLWSLEHDADFKKADDELTLNITKRNEVDAQIPNVMVMEEMPKPRDAFVLVRGEYDKHGDKVEAGLPSFLPATTKIEPNNRLGLARWIVSPENPLTARVTVNRFWERFFGTGIVATVEDFGTRAEYPSNPELLDFLATEFLRLKWDQKAMIKEIVMSAAYRQSSHTDAEKLEKDPHNRLISRGPRYRLPGEVIRDQALYASGLLVEKLGGPSVYPVQPEGIWDETNFYGNLRNYKADKGDGRYRRSLYTIWKRTAAPPNMLLFDVPSREACRVQRARTDTPLQALTLMNDETFLEAARVLAQKIMREGGNTVEGRLTYAFERVVCRTPSASEMSVMRAAFDKRLARYQADPEEAKTLVKIGAAPTDRTLDPAELAAYTITASMLLNLDEVVNIQ